MLRDKCKRVFVLCATQSAVSIYHRAHAAPALREGRRSLPTTLLNSRPAENAPSYGKLQACSQLPNRLILNISPPLNESSERGGRSGEAVEAGPDHSDDCVDFTRLQHLGNMTEVIEKTPLEWRQSTAHSAQGTRG